MRKIAARQLVFPLARPPRRVKGLRDGVIDGLGSSGLEMQERVVFDRPPIAAVKRIAADEIQCPPRSSAAARQTTQQDALGASSRRGG